MTDTRHMWSASELRTFKECRRKYYYKYVRRIETRHRPSYFGIGSMVHAGIEAILLRRSYLDAMLDVAPGEVSSDEGLVAQACIEAFHRQVPWQEWEVHATEEPWDRTLAGGIKTMGITDAVVEWQEQLWLVEFKTKAAGGWEKYASHLAASDQCSLYLLNEPQAAGMLYVVIDKPRLKRKDDEGDCEYLGRLDQWFRKGERVHIARQRRDAEHKRQFKLELLRIEGERCDLDGCGEASYYRNPHACSLIGCPFSPICYEGAGDEAAELLYRKRPNRTERMQEAR